MELGKQSNFHLSVQITGIFRAYWT